MQILAAAAPAVRAARIQADQRGPRADHPARLPDAADHKELAKIRANRARRVLLTHRGDRGNNHAQNRLTIQVHRQGNQLLEPKRGVLIDEYDLITI